MTLNKIRLFVNNNKNVIHNFIFHGSRNQNEYFTGKIVEVYPSIFVIKLEDGQIKSYSYSDLLIGNIEIVN